MRRTIGVNTWVWTSPLDDAALAEIAPKAADMGFCAIELPVEQPADWSPDPIHDVVKAVSEALGIGMGKIAQPMRVAITGTQVSPSIDHTVFLAGRAAALARIDAALARIPA